MNWKTCATDDRPEPWLGDALGVELEASGLRPLAQNITLACAGPTAAAQSLFRHVAQLPYAISDMEGRCNPRLLSLTSEGDAHFKATLFVHLLRLVGVPARMRWVQLQSELITRGFWDFVRHTGQPFVYPLTEVYLDERWLCTDAYALDAPLLEAVHQELDRRGWPCGYLAHRSGVAVWDAQTDAYQRFVPDDPQALLVQDMGCSHSEPDFAGTSQQNFRHNRVLQQAYASQAVLMAEELNRLRLGR